MSIFRGISSKIRKNITRWAAVYGIAVLTLSIAVIALSPVSSAQSPNAALLRGLGGGGGGIPVTDIGQKISNVIKDALKTVADVQFKRMLSQYLNNLAYNTAIKIATGEQGQRPLFEENLGTILQDAADGAVGDYLNDYARSAFGRDLCKPDAPERQTTILYYAGLTELPDLPKARCPLTKIIDNVRTGQSQLLREYQAFFNPEASDIGSILLLEDKKNEVTSLAKENAALRKSIEGPCRSVTTPVSGAIITPGVTVCETLNNLLPQSLQQYGVYTGSAVADAIGVFTNTLSAKLLGKIFGEGGGFNPGADSRGQGFAELTGSSGVLAAREQFAQLIVPEFGDTQALDVLNQLQIENVLDPSFAEAVRQKLSVQRAIDIGLLDGDKVFGFSAGGIEPEVRSGYRYSSMKFLRKYRIVPVGWELAAQYIRDFSGATFTLQDVVDQYENTTSPFYKLVDPNWTLTIPEHVCKRTGFTADLLPNTCRPIPLDNFDKFANPDFPPAAGTPDAHLWTPEVYDDVNADNDFSPTGQGTELQESSKLACTRAEECVDEQSCVVTNPDGTCKEFGYCVEDRDIWRFDGVACEPQYATCLTFADPDGNTGSYLTSTLDYNSCGADNAGCQWYCRDYDAANDTFACENSYSTAVPAVSGNFLSYIDALSVDSPSGIAAALDGTIYTTSFNEHVIYRIDPDLGAKTVVFGDPDPNISAAGNCATDFANLNAAEGLAIDKSSNDQFLLVADTGCSRVLKIDTRTWQVVSSNTSTPPYRDITTDGNGIPFGVYNNFVDRLNPATFAATATTTTPASSDNWGVATDSAGNVYVATYFTHYIKKFDNGLAAEIGSYPPFAGAAADPNFTGHPIGIDVDAQGQVYVVEYDEPSPGGNRAFVLDPTMTTKIATFGEWGVRGSGDSHLSFPYRPVVTAAGVFIADRGNDRIMRLSGINGVQCVTDSGDSCTVTPGATSCNVECVLPSACTGGNCTCVTASGLTCQVPSGNTSCTPLDPASNPYSCILDNSKRWLDSDVASCNASAAGCHEFLQTTGTNLIANSSFEYLSGTSVIDDGVPDTFNGWVTNGGVETYALSDAFYDQTALHFVNNGAAGNRMEYPVDTGYALDGRTFTVSVFGKVNPTPLGITCTTTFGVESDILAGASNGVETDIALTQDWQQFFLTYVVPQDGRDRVIRPYIREASATGAACGTPDMVFDGIQIEETSQVTSYKDYGATGSLFLNEDRLACTEQEVGCELYTSTTTGVRIPGVVRPGDQCPADQVGCRGFRELAVPSFPTRPERDYINTIGDVDYLQPFIAGSGQSCSAASAGCEEYTNLDEVAQGGEGREYYTSLRLCIQENDPNAAIETYYSWSGSAVTGFQLNAHRLLDSDPLNPGPDGPCSNVDTSTGPPFNQCDDANFDLDGDGAIDSVDCKSVYGTNPDCQEYFDPTGNAYYRWRSRTVTVSSDCHPLRETERRCSNGGALGHYCSQDSDCDIGGGGGICDPALVYHAIPSENISCPAAHAGCREYEGNTGQSAQTVFSEDFEDGDTAGWSSSVISTESITFGGHSAYHSPGPLNTTSATLNDALLKEDGTYVLTFWAKADSSVATDINTLALNGNNGSSLFVAAASPIALTESWNLYVVGPVTYSAIPDGMFLIYWFSGGGVFVDNVTLREVTDNQYQVHDTWTTCDHANIGCDRYRDRTGGIHTISSFTSICRDQAIGCEALFDTQNSSNPFSEIFQTGAASVTVPDDTLVYRVNDARKYCQESAKGCSRLGEPVLNIDAGVDAWQTQYLLDDPDQYDRILCNHLESGCQAFTSEESDVQYFKEPGPFLCEYRENVTVSQSLPPADGWYKTDTFTGAPNCPGSPAFPLANSFCANDPAFVNNPCTTDNDCGAGVCVHWVGTCPGGQSSCTLYEDRQDEDYQLGGGRYHYLANSVDTSACPEGINKAGGCLPFYEDDESSSTIRSSGDLGELTLSPNGCHECSTDAATCGYQGQPACCDASDPDIGACTIYSAQADVIGTVAPNRWCLDDGGYPHPQNTASARVCLPDTDPSGCILPDDPTVPTNCGGAGQPFCCVGTDGVGNTPDDALDPQRRCTDFGCDANTVLSVNRDRECEAWLACTDSERIEKPNGDIENVCFARQRCTVWQDGRCADAAAPPQGNITAERQPIAYTLDDLQNRTGLVSGGVMWGCSQSGLACVTDADCGSGETCEIIEGLWPYGAMIEEGLAGKDIEIENADFEEKESAIADIDPLAKFSFWEPDNGAQILVQRELFNDNFANRYAQVQSADTASNGIRQDLGIHTNKLDETVGLYTVSFDAYRNPASTVDENSLIVSIGQDVTGDRVVDNILWTVEAPIRLTSNWRKYTAQLVNSTTAALTVNGGPVYLLFHHADANPVNESFYLDNVDFNPALRIRDTAVAGSQIITGASGLQGEYYTSSTSTVLQSGSCQNPAPGVCAGGGTLCWKASDCAGGAVCNEIRSASWTGTFNIAAAGNYAFYVNPNDYVRVQIDGKTIIDITSGSFGGGGGGAAQVGTHTAPIPLGAGVHTLDAIWIDTGNHGGVQLGMKQNGSTYGNEYAGGLPKTADWPPGTGVCDDGSFTGTPSTPCEGWQQAPAIYGQDILQGNLTATLYRFSNLAGDSVSFSDTAVDWYQGVNTPWNSPPAWITNYCINPGPNQYIPCDPAVAPFNSACDSSAGAGDGICAPDNADKLSRNVPPPIACSDAILETANTACGVDTDCDYVTTTSNADFATLQGSSVDATLNWPDFTGQLTAQAGQSVNTAVRWNGAFLADQATGTYNICVDHDDGARVTVNGVKYIDNWTNTSTIDCTPDLNLGTGTNNWIPIVVEYYNAADPARLILYWDTDGGANCPGGAGCAVLPSANLTTGASLQVNGVHVGRSCRSYPTDDAPRCNLVDPETKTIYNGWKGYCVEPDPLNPRECLQWWPVDVISGEENLFGQQQSTVLRSNLSYCTETQLRPFVYNGVTQNTNYPQITCLARSAHQAGGSSNDQCEIIAIFADPKPLLWEVLEGNRSACDLNGDGIDEWSGCNGPAANNADPWVIGDTLRDSLGDGGFNVPSWAYLSSNMGDCCDINAVTNTNTRWCKFFKFSGASTSAIDGNQHLKAADMLNMLYHKTLFMKWHDNNNNPNDCSNHGNQGLPEANERYRADLGLPHQCSVVDINPADNRFCNSPAIAGTRPLADWGILSGVALDSAGAGQPYAIAGKAYVPADYQTPPQICTTVSVVSRDDGTGTPWASRVLGGYAEHPLQYRLTTQCSPYGSLPATTRQPSQIGEISLFNGVQGYNTIFSSGDICKKERFGNGTYSSGAPILRTCIGGPDHGKNCSGNGSVDCRLSFDNKEGQCSSTCEFDDLTTANRLVYCNTDADCSQAVANGPAVQIGSPARDPLCMPRDLLTGTTHDRPFNDLDATETQNDGIFFNYSPPNQYRFDGILNSGKERLRQLFAASISAWTWDATNSKFIPANSNIFNWHTPDAAAAPGFPEGYVGTGYLCGTCSSSGSTCQTNGDCPAGQTCENIRGDVANVPQDDQFCAVRPAVPDPLNDITLNSEVATCVNNPAQTCTVANEAVDCPGSICGVVLGGANNNVSFQFAMTINKEQQPIKQSGGIAVDWGDGSIISNYQGFSMSHTYSCPDDGNGGCASCASGGTLFDYTGDGLRDCMYAGPNDTGAIRFQVEDNWGWCNHAPDPTGTNPGEVGCETPGVGQTNTWNYWPGRVIVRP